MAAGGTRGATGGPRSAPPRAAAPLQPLQDAGAARVVVAVIANRAREVGVAALDCDALRLSLNQLVEPSRALGTAAALVHAHAPQALLVPASTAAQRQTHLSGLLERDRALAARALAVGRAEFDDTAGWELVSQLAAKEPCVQAQAERHNSWYLALAAAHAVARYALAELGVDLFQPAAVDLATVSFDTLATHMVIDRTTLAELEVLNPIRTVATNALKDKSRDGPAPAAPGPAGGATLLELIGGRLATHGGRRLLRANLLQPLRDMNTLCTRQDAVAELLERPRLHEALIEALGKCPNDADAVTVRLAAPPPKAGTQASPSALAARLNDLLKVKAAVRCAPMLAAAFSADDDSGLNDTSHALTGGGGPYYENPSASHGPHASAQEIGADSPVTGGGPRSALLRALAAIFDDQRGTLAALSSLIDRQVEDDALTAKQAFQSRVQCIYAIKPGADGLLDLARSLFAETTEQVHEAAQRYRSETGLRTLKMPYDQRRGFYLTVSAKELRDRQAARAARQHQQDDEADEREGDQMDWGPSLLPPGFVNPATRGQAVHITTHELMQLNARMSEAAHDALQRSVAAAASLLDRARAAARPLCQLAEAISLLDLCVNGLAVVSATQGYCRPTLLDSADAPLALRRARHPVLGALDPFSYVPNSVLLTTQTRLLVLCGPNASGKTTYLRAMCLCVLMAHIGCWVPAESASVRLTDRMLSRLGVDDCLETNASSFSLEMREIAFCLHTLSDRALVAIDELGRSTSDADSLALSWAVAEALLASRAYSAMATHEHRLARLQRLYPAALCASMAVRVVAGEGAHAQGRQAPDGASVRLDFKYEIEDGLAAAMTSSHYGLALAEAVGFPRSVVADARTIADVVGRAREAREAAAASGSGAAAAEDARRELKFEAARRLAGLRFASRHMPREQVLRCLASVRRALVEGLDRIARGEGKEGV